MVDKFSLLPSELIHLILPNLDFQTIFDLSLANKTLHGRVCSCPDYQLLVSNPRTRSTLKILSQTTLLSRHTLSTLLHSLHTETCICCLNSPAPYLYLPTARRACFTCVHYCPQFQLIPIDLASSTFAMNLTSSHDITLLVVAGVYRIEGEMVTLFSSSPLVNAAQARDMAIRNIGATQLDRHMASRDQDVVLYKTVSGSTMRFVMPYTSMDFDACEVRLKGQKALAEMESWETQRLVDWNGGARGRWRGNAGMGCEPWPWIDRVTGQLVLDKKLLTLHRIKNFNIKVV